MNVFVLRNMNCQKLLDSRFRRLKTILENGVYCLLLLLDILTIWETILLPTSQCN